MGLPMNGSANLFSDEFYARPHPGPLPRGEGETLECRRRPRPSGLIQRAEFVDLVLPLLRLGFSLRRLIRIFAENRVNTPRGLVHRRGVLQFAPVNKQFWEVRNTVC